jgi:DNA repair protein RecO
MLIPELALVLRRTPLRETSLLLELFTEGRGRMATVAKGVRMPTRSGQEQRAALAGFHRVMVQLHGRRPTDLMVLRHVDIDQARHHLTRQPVCNLAAQLMSEALYRRLAPHDAHPELFRLTDAAWESLDAGEAVLMVVSRWLVHFNRLTGYGWRLACCIVCQRVDTLAYFSIKQSGMVCATCGAPFARHMITISPPMLALLADRVAWHPDVLSPEEWMRLYRMGVLSIHYHGGCVLAADPPLREALLHVTTEPDSNHEPSERIDNHAEP